MAPLPYPLEDLAIAAREVVARAAHSAPLHYLKAWAPLAFPAFSIIGLLGADEVAKNVGTLQRRRFTGYVPLPAAYVIASDGFVGMETGFHLYNLTDAIYTPELRPWFTRWLSAQDVNNGTSIFTWKVVEPQVYRDELKSGPSQDASRTTNGQTEGSEALSSEKHISAAEQSKSVREQQPNLSPTGRLLKTVALLLRQLDMGVSLVSFTIGCVLHLPLLVCTILMHDWYGMANAISLILTVLARVYQVYERRAGIVDTMLGTKAKSRTEDQPMKKILVLRNDGKMVTIYAPENIVKTFFLPMPVRSTLLYWIVQNINWLAYAVHLVALGSASLFTQLYSVVIIVGGTYAYFARLGLDIFKCRIEDAPTERFSYHPFGSRVQVTHENPYKDGFDRRMWAIARIMPTAEELKMLELWMLLPIKFDHVALSAGGTVQSGKGHSALAKSREWYTDFHDVRKRVRGEQGVTHGNVCEEYDDYVSVETPANVVRSVTEEQAVAGSAS